MVLYKRKYEANQLITYCVCSFLVYSAMNPDSLIHCGACLAWGSLL